MIGDYKNRLPIHAATHNPKIRCLALLVQHLQLRELSSTDDEVGKSNSHWCVIYVHGVPVVKPNDKKKED